MCEDGCISLIKAGKKVGEWKNLERKYMMKWIRDLMTATICLPCFIRDRN